MPRLQGQFEFALQQVVGIVDAVAHLQVVVERHALDRRSVGLALRLERGECVREVFMRIELPGQRHAVLERAVHALAVERHHRVRGIAQQHRAAVEMPALQIQRRQLADRVAGPVAVEVGDQGQRRGKIALEERARGRGVLQLVEGGALGLAGVMRQEQGDGEGLLVVG